MDIEAAELAADPVRAEAARRARNICNCKVVDLGTIEDAIHDHGLTTVQGVKDHTSASGGCGTCSERVQGVLDAMLAMPAALAAE
ncbi:MAG: (2Fe-2S)-binding protein [Acidiphilium sp.]|nr:(2Fe-2S)-binding protein [Acidiphilium sp.]MDD4935132.1 (2Fe-2S)-binding protein [Acidiphilium sp.]